MTSLVGGYRVSKTHPRLEAYGAVDELNSFIGLLITEIEDAETADLLLFIQSKLFDIGAYLATDPQHSPFVVNSHITQGDIQRLEDAIDLITGGLPEMKSFVLPGGCRSAALAHVCRTVCRRAERDIFRLAEAENENLLEQAVFIFINRMSDLLFVMARSECLREKDDEIIWDNACN